MAEPRETARRFLADIGAAWGPRLRCAVLHGSVARGDAILGVSDINLLLLVDGIRMEDLARAGPHARRWMGLGNSPPLLVDSADWTRAADVFAIEISDMLEHREVLRGDDPLEGVVVAPAALRFQLELELRASLIRLHDTLMVSAEQPGDVGALLLRALPSFEAYFRSTLRLVGRAVPADAAGVITRTAEVVGGDPTGFLEARRARESGAPPARPLSHPSVEGFYRLAERTVRYVDGLDRPRGNDPTEESRP